MANHVVTVASGPLKGVCRNAQKQGIQTAQKKKLICKIQQKDEES